MASDPMKVFVKLDVGQRWATGGGEFTITSVHAESCATHASGNEHVHWNDGGWDFVNTLRTHRDYRLLGGPLKPAEPRAGDRYRDYEGRFFTLTKYESDSVWAGKWDHGSVANKPLVDFSGWAEGLVLELVDPAPRPAVTLPSVPAAMMTCKCCGLLMSGTPRTMCTDCVRRAEKVTAASAERYQYGCAARAGVEMTEDSIALSAIGHVPARKPPEPWTPSIDEWDLLPDAGR